MREHLPNEQGNEGGSVTVGLPNVLTLGALIAAYQTNPASSYHKLRYHVRRNHDGTLRRLNAAHGSILLSDIRPATVQVWYNEWSKDGHIAMAHTFVAQIRTLFGFGLLMLEDRECERLSLIMSKMKFPQPEPGTAFLTVEMADAICTKAHLMGWGSIALAQAFQFDLLLRQKDVIGEWIPVCEPGESDIIWRDEKWLRGLRWSEIDDDRILRHKTSKRGKVLEIGLKLAPMVLRELQHVVYRSVDGPIILNEINGMPWSAAEFRRKWRILADQAGIPKEIKSMHSRAGGITEASEAGADIEHIKHAATHSDIAMTQRYSRNASAKIANVQTKRLEHRRMQEAQ
jgi:Phage integrase family